MQTHELAQVEKLCKILKIPFSSKTERNKEMEDWLVIAISNPSKIKIIDNVIHAYPQRPTIIKSPFYVCSIVIDNNEFYDKELALVYITILANKK